MPELPEVEHARGLLDAWLCGATILGVELLDPRLARPGAQAQLASRVVSRVSRRGKWLRIETDGPSAFCHLGMTGRWARAVDDARHVRARLTSRRGSARLTLAFVDPRRFGRLEVRADPPPAFLALGPDPLLDGLDPAALGAALSRRRGAVQLALLDQSVCAGIGNIQATEALFLAGVDPRRPARSLSAAEVERVCAGLRRTIQDTLAAQPAELVYLSEGGPNPFRIYGRAGAPCPRCTRPLERTTQGGRPTALCPRCQR